MNWTERSACVANLPRSHKHTRALPAAAAAAAAAVMVLLYCGWLWCCYYLCLRSLVLSRHFCDEKTNKRKKGKRQNEKDLNEFLWINRRKRTAVLVPGKTKQRKKEKKKKKKNGENTQKKCPSQKTKKAKNFGRIPQQIISSSAITGREGLRGGRIRRAYPPKWARSK